MKFNRALVLSLSVGMSVVLPGCGLKKMLQKAKDQKLTLVPSPLELHGDSVKFEASANLPLGMLKPNKTYGINLNYHYKDQKEALGEIIFKGNDFRNSNTEEPQVTKKFAFPYRSDAMDRGEVKLDCYASNINGKTRNLPTMPFPDGKGKGILTTSRLIGEVFYPAYAPHGYDNSDEFTSASVEFFFEQNKSILRKSEMESTRAKELDAFIKSKNTTRTVTVTGAHSPEGTEARNTALAEQRAKVVEMYYKSVLKQNKFSQAKIDSIEFITRSLVQNWKSFKDTVSVYGNLTTAQKAEINGIVDGPGTFSEKELQLSKLDYYKEIYKVLYPKLRNAYTEILTVLPKKTDSRIAFLAKEIVEGRMPADVLTDKELAYAATLTPLPAEKEAIYLAATKKNDSWASHNNLACVYLEQAKKMTGADREKMLDKARSSLRIAQNKEYSAIIRTNQANYFLMKGDLINAGTEITTANSLSPDPETKKVINSLAGSSLIREGKYDLAIKTYSNAVKDPSVQYNMALAQLLAKQYDKAGATLQLALNGNPASAKSHYLLAVLSARQGKEDQVAKSLATAIKLDNKLREKAIADMEFDRIASNDSFKNAIK